MGNEWMESLEIESLAMTARSHSKGFTLVEIMVAMSVVLFLLGAAFGMWSKYRGRSEVARAAEITKAVVERAIEDAKSAGYPLSDELRGPGLTTPASPESTPGSSIFIQINRRLGETSELQLVTEHQLSRSSSVIVGFQALGVLDLKNDPKMSGLFVTFTEKDSNGVVRTLCTIPVDVNGELVFQGTSGQASIRFRYDEVFASLTLGHRGTIALDKR